MKKELKTIYAEISWLCIPWEEIKVISRDGERFITGTICEPILDKKIEPNYWKVVRDKWYRAFEENKKNVIQGYYRMYGPLNVIPRKDLTFDQELWKLNEFALGWFNLLTCMTEWIKSWKTGPLWELYGEPHLSDSPKIQLYPKEGQKRHNPFYSIEWRSTSPVSTTQKITRETLFFQTPKDDSQLLQAAWYTVIEEVKKLLNEIRLIPAERGEHNNRNLTWQFLASGAFQAAFLQWYLQELSNFKVESCAKPGCENSVPQNRKKYCSERCYWAAAKQRHRAKKRDI